MGARGGARGSPLARGANRAGVSAGAASARAGIRQERLEGGRAMLTLKSGLRIHGKLVFCETGKRQSILQTYRYGQTDRLVLTTNVRYIILAGDPRLGP